jgi:hypothetical protein
MYFKKTLQIALVALIAAAVVNALRAAEQGQGREPEARVALRVFQDGAAIGDLEKQGVELLIDGAPQAISGWQKVTKKIAAPGAESRRFFVLIFHLDEYPANLSQALGKLFQGLLRDNDRLLVLANQATLLIENLTNREKSAAAVEAFVKEQARRFRQTLESEQNNLLKIVGKMVSDYVRVTANVHRHYYMKGFNSSLEEYLSLLQEYKRRYLLPAPGLFSGLCKQLSGIRDEKWIIAFWQLSEIPKFPRSSRDFIARLADDYQQSALLDENDYGKRYNKRLLEIEEVYVDKSTFPGPDICNLLTGLEATLHAFYVSPRDPALGNDPDFKNVAEQSRKILAGVANNSGGLFRSFAEPESDMAAIAEKVDSYYVLNFSPVLGYRKVDIGLPDKKLSAWYDPLAPGERKKACQAQTQMQVELRDVILQNRKLAFKIVRFLKDVPKHEAKAEIFVRVYLKDGQGRLVFDQSRYLAPQKTEIAMILELVGVPPGGYGVAIEVGDRLTGRTQIRLLNAQLE